MCLIYLIWFWFWFTLCVCFSVPINWGEISFRHFYVVWSLVRRKHIECDRLFVRNRLTLSNCSIWLKMCIKTFSVSKSVSMSPVKILTWKSNTSHLDDEKETYRIKGLFGYISSNPLFLPKWNASSILILMNVCTAKNLRCAHTNPEYRTIRHDVKCGSLSFDFKYEWFLYTNTNSTNVTPEQTIQLKPVLQQSMIQVKCYFKPNNLYTTRIITTVILLVILCSVGFF